MFGPKRCFEKFAVTSAHPYNLYSDRWGSESLQKNQNVDESPCSKKLKRRAMIDSECLPTMCNHHELFWTPMQQQQSPHRPSQRN